jgi:hypothetical protein
VLKPGKVSKLIWLVCIFTFLLQAKAQQQERPVPAGSFQKDSVRIGEVISYSFSCRYPSTMEIIFPDSSFDFSPFEYVGKIYAPTRSKSGISLDSTTYLLRTFEVEQVQRLSLPVFVLEAGDTLLIHATLDSVGLQQMVRTPLSNPLALQLQTSLLLIPKRFNYPYLMVGLVAGAAILLLLWQIFGASIRTNFMLYTLKKDHNQFLNRFNGQVERFRRSETLSNMEKAVSLWKNYLTKLEGKPINSFTTREISDFYEEDEDVSTALKLCDRAIYGNIIANEASESSRALSLLQNFAVQRYTIIRENTRNATTTRRNLQLATR